MPALTVRNLPDEVHARMRERAANAGLSMESYIRRTLAESTADPAEDKAMNSTGFAEASAAFIHDAPGVSGAQMPGLWGALRGSVSVAADCDLTAPMGEAWSAEA